MSAGGFKFAKVTIQGDSASYAAVTDWGLAVHKARCEAFLRATERENGHWTPVETSLTGETTTSVNYDDENTATVYYTQIAPSTTYPCYLSVFQDTDSNAQYMLLTGAGFTPNSASSTCAYINPARANKLETSGSGYYRMSPSFMHAMAMNGFSSYDPSESAMAEDEIPFTAQYGIGTAVQSNAYTYNKSMVYQYTGASYTGYPYTFGFAVKGTVIESFYQFDGGVPFWSIIGEIFESDCIGSHPYGVLASPSTETSEVTTVVSHQKWVDDAASQLCAMDYEGNHYPNASIKSAASANISSRCMPSYNACRANATVPTNLYYGSLCCGFFVSPSSPQSIAGLDADGNLQKGYISSDILRVVSPFLCRSAGSIFQSGAFIGMGSTSTDAGVLGILLGWDSSNDSLM